MKQSLTLFALLALIAGFTSRSYGATGNTYDVVNPTPPNLGAAAGYEILAYAGVANGGAAGTSITGNVGTYPQTETGLTGFAPTGIAGDAHYYSIYVVGNLDAADNAVATSSNLNTATNDVFSVSGPVGAYTFCTNGSVGTVSDVDESAGLLGGLTLGRGYYTFNSAVNIATDLTLNGTATDIFVFQISGSLTIASATNVILTGGALASNIYWAVAGGATLGSTSTFYGNILNDSATVPIAFVTGASLHGRALSHFSVTLQGDVVDLTSPPPPGSPTNTPSGTPTNTPNGSFTPTPTGTPTSTKSPTSTTSPTATASPTSTSSPTPSATRTATLVSTFTTSPTRTPTFTITPTSTCTPCSMTFKGAWGASYIYPSPAKGATATIAYALRQDGSVTIKIYNQTGRLVDTITESNAAGWETTVVSTGKFASGTYYYLVYDDYGAAGTEKQGPYKFVVLH